MWGVQFKEAGNALICGSAEFEVRRIKERTGRQTSKVYRVLFGPHEGMSIQRAGPEGWETIKRRAEAADLEAILPQGDFMHRWTYGDFMIALTFFGEGHKIGYAQGQYDQRQWDARQIQAAEGQREQCQ